MIWLWGSLNPLHGGGGARDGSTCCPGFVDANNVFGISFWYTVPRLTLCLIDKKILVIRNPRPFLSNEILTWRKCTKTCIGVVGAY